MQQRHVLQQQRLVARRAGESGADLGAVVLQLVQPACTMCMCMCMRMCMCMCVCVCMRVCMHVVRVHARANPRP